MSQGSRGPGVQGAVSGLPSSPQTFPIREKLSLFGEFLKLANGFSYFKVKNNFILYPLTKRRYYDSWQTLPSPNPQPRAWLPSLSGKPSSTFPKSPALLCKLTSSVCPQWMAGARVQWLEERLCCHTVWVGTPAPALSCEARQDTPEPQNRW